MFRPKHPVKVHIWGGISWHGRTPLVVFEGVMDAAGFIRVIEQGCLPFVRDVLPNHRFMQDNDPKHCSRLATDFLAENGVNWWQTPPESPDINPVENLWHELKEYQRRVVKPTSKGELIQGIVEFWNTVDIEKCRKYIRHLRKVVPKIIEYNGGATGY